MGEWVRGSPGLISPHEAVCGSESLSPPLSIHIWPHVLHGHPGVLEPGS